MRCLSFCIETNSKQNKVGWEMVHGFTSEKPAFQVFLP